MDNGTNNNVKTESKPVNDPRYVITSDGMRVPYAQWLEWKKWEQN